MREIRPSGLEGGAGSNTPFLPLSPEQLQLTRQRAAFVFLTHNHTHTLTLSEVRAESRSKSEYEYENEARREHLIPWQWGGSFDLSVHGKGRLSQISGAKEASDSIALFDNEAEVIRFHRPIGQIPCHRTISSRLRDGRDFDLRLRPN